MSAFQAEDGGFKSPRGGHHFSQKTGKIFPWRRWQGAEYSKFTRFHSLAVLRGGFVKLHNLVHSLTVLYN